MPAPVEMTKGRRAADHVRRLFETDCEVFFAFNATAANSLALAARCQSDHSVTCALGPGYSRGQPDAPGSGEWKRPADADAARQTCGAKAGASTPFIGAGGARFICSWDTDWRAYARWRRIVATPWLARTSRCA
jgi:hypothetical protein